MNSSTKSFWIQIFKAFKSESGEYVLLSTIVSRISTFAAAWLALQLIDNNVLGHAIFAYQIIIFVLPFIGLGLYQGLLRFGAQINAEKEKSAMFLSVLKKGIIATLLLSFSIFVLSGFLTMGMPEAHKYLQLFAIVLFTSFLNEILKTYFRILNRNKYFAFTEITYSLIFLILIGSFSYLWGVDGYVLAFIIAPLFSFFIWIKKAKLKFNSNGTEYIITKKFWYYGFYASMGNVTTQLLFVIDLLLIGSILMNAEMVTIYKYITLVPFSILFISQVYMTTHFVQITKFISDHIYVKNFIKTYHTLFFVICILFLGAAWVLKLHILAFFDESFIPYTRTFFILCIGISSILLIRGLYGNLLSAMGYANINFMITFFGVIINVALNFYLIPLYGLDGAAFTSALIMWTTSILSALVFYLLSHKLSESRVKN